MTFSYIHASSDLAFSRKIGRSSDESTSPAKEREKELLRLAKLGNSKALEDLVLRGVSLNAADHSQRTALHFGASQVDLPLVQLLLSHGAEVNRRNNVGQTPLHMVALVSEQSRMKDAEEIVKLLLRAGAQTDYVDDGFFSPIEYARRAAPSLVQILRDHQAGISTSLRIGQPASSVSPELPIGDELITLADVPSIDQVSSFNNAANRSLLMSLLVHQQVEKARKLLIGMAVTELLEDTTLIAESYREIGNRILPSLNMLSGLGHPRILKGSTHVKRICWITLWEKFLVTIFLDELRMKILPTDCPQVEQMKSSVVDYLISSLEKLLVKVTSHLSQTRSLIMTPVVREFLNPKECRVTFTQPIEDEITHLQSLGRLPTARKSLFSRMSELEDIFNASHQKVSSRESEKLPFSYLM